MSEKEAKDAPVYFSAEEASAWASGWNEAEAKIRELLDTDDQIVAAAWEDGIANGETWALDAPQGQTKED